MQNTERVRKAGTWPAPGFHGQPAGALGGISCRLGGALRENRPGESRPGHRALGSGTLISEAQRKDLSSY